MLSPCTKLQHITATSPGGLLLEFLVAKRMQLGGEHQPEQRRPLAREPHIAESHGRQLFAFGEALRRLVHGEGKVAKSLGGDRLEQRLAIGEVPVGCRRRYPDQPRNLAQAQRRGTVFLEQHQAAGHQRPPQVAMMVSRFVL